MSTMLRLIRLQSFKSGLSSLTTKGVVRNVACRTVSTSPKKDDPITEDQPYLTKRTWVSYGFDYDDKRMDRHIMHQTMFVTVTICLVFGAFVIAYAPDVSMKDWAQREAHLQVRYREEHGLPLIDPNVVDPSKIILPTDEELGNTEIII